MNWQRMKKNVGCHVQLEPTACCLDGKGQEVPATASDDDWIIANVSDDGVHLQNGGGRMFTLGKDHIHHFTSNPERSTALVRYGFLTLNVQVYLQSNGISMRPNSRPGEPVKPRDREIIEKWVDISYPSDIGLQQRLQAAGFRIAWCFDSRIPRKIDLEGWGVVIEPDPQGVLTKFRLRDRPENQTLIKKPF